MPYTGYNNHLPTVPEKSDNDRISDIAMDLSSKLDARNEELTVCAANLAVHKAALESMRAELSDARAERDRYIARCKLLESRIESARSTLEGK
jgi:chromosome segregation ATPase